MKRLSDSPELIIIAIGLIFASVLFMFSFFYEEPIQVTNVVHHYDSTQAEPADSNAVTADSSLDKININSADITSLCTLDSIGETKAKRIIDYRTSNGKFSTIEDIMNVEGIGESTFKKIKDKITT